MLLYYLLVGFLGYFIGRLGHIYGGNIKFFHHWVYGLTLCVICVIGIILSSVFWGLYVFSFGLGLFISDSKDFLNFKIYGIDDVKIKKFWGID